MDQYIKLEDAIAIIEAKQKELCPVGRYGKGYVYGSDREKYDVWDEIIDALENVSAHSVATVVHGKWERVANPNWPAHIHDKCSICGWWNTRNALCYDGRKGHDLNYCPNCGAKMDGGTDYAVD